MTTLDEALRALVKKWRRIARDCHGTFTSDAYTDAADELAALLTTRQEVVPVARFYVPSEDGDLECSEAVAIAWDKRDDFIRELQAAQPPAFRGYANLGVGAYLLEHSAESEDAELMIVPATEAEKVGRTVGDLKHFEGEREPIPAERVAVRLRFSNVAGLDALEQQLRILREVHFAGSTGQTSDARDGEIARLRRCLGFFASVIKSGESWSATCQSEYDAAMEGLK